MNSTPHRVGLVGYGLAGRVFHAPFVDAQPDLRLEVIVTSSAARAAAARAAHPHARIVATLDDIDDDALDLLVLGAPPQTHRAQAIWALDRGIAVVVDKPFMPSVADAEHTLDFAARRGGRLTVFHNRRWDGDFLALRDIVAGGALGDVFEFHSAFEHWDPRPANDWKLTLPVVHGGGVTMDLGSHLVDQALLLFGPVESVDADLRRVRAGAGNDDVADVVLTHRTGVHSHLRMSRLGAQPPARFRVSGTDGSAAVWGLDPQEALLEAGTPVAELAAHQPGRFVQLATGATPEVTEVPVRPGAYLNFYDGVARWLSGEAPAPVAPHEALEVLRTLELATAALRAS